MSEVPEPVRNPAELRCSDVDRERVAEALRKAAGDGRLSLTELDDRLEAAFKARTYGDLRPITHDLPQGPYPLPGAPATWSTPDVPASKTTPAPARPTASGPAPARQRINSILGEEKRRGRWEVAERIDVTTVCGSVELDFTEAVVHSDEVIISGAVVLGSLKLIVPEGSDVQFETSANVLGEQKSTLKGPISPDATTFRVRGLIVLGEVKARSPRKK